MVPRNSSFSIQTVLTYLGTKWFYVCVWFFTSTWSFYPSTSSTMYMYLVPGITSACFFLSPCHYLSWPYSCSPFQYELYYGGPQLIGPMVYIKTYIFNHFHYQYLVLLTMAPRNSPGYTYVQYTIPGILKIARPLRDEFQIRFPPKHALRGTHNDNNEWWLWKRYRREGRLEDIARRIQCALPVVETISYENRPRGCVILSPQCDNVIRYVCRHT